MHLPLSLCFSIVLTIIIQYHAISYCALSFSESKCHPDESSALLGLNPNYGGNKSADCCSWYGVTCDGTTGRVIGLVIAQVPVGNITENSSLFVLSHLETLVVYQLLSISAGGFRSLARSFANLRRLEMYYYVDMSEVPLVSLANLSSSLTTLDLRYIGLRGELPVDFFRSRKLQELTILERNSNVRISEAAIAALARNSTGLETLQLWGVNMSSVPMVSLTNLSSSLTHLALSSCLLAGELPAKFFLSFPKLELLILDENSISGQILDFCTLGNLSSSCMVGSPPSNLTTLSLSFNSIRGPIPRWIFALPYLQLLLLSSNRFTGEIGNFTSSSLTHLYLGGNQLQGGIPRSIFHLTKLQNLDLSSNNLTTTVEFEELSGLLDLFLLNLSFNKMTLSFKHSLENFSLRKLSRLGLASCNLGVFPPFLELLTNLWYLDVSDNHIKGSVPTWLWEVGKHSLYFLNISHNSITGIDPLPWYSLAFLYLNNNSLSGPLPILSPAFKVFSASKNRFSGEIPTSVCSLRFIQVLDLSFNNLIGKVPQCLGNLNESLSDLDLRHNKLRGSISATFALGNKLRSLNLNGNHIDGTIPRSLVNCSNLEVLDLGNNALNDTFPDWLESLPELQVLVLRANKLHGSIGNPMSRSPFFKLRIMDLSQNEFTGDVPSYFKSFKAVQMDEKKVQPKYMGGRYYQDSVTVSLKGNDFVLEKILTIFTAIDFSRNNFSGEIPQVLGELVSLKGLNLSHNMVEGTIPSSLGKLKNLEWLDLCSNRLVGEIPADLADVTSLSILNLSYNHLEGPIPRGSQFNTFPNDSFVGNLDLCGFPLSKLCGDEAEPSPPAPEQDEDGDDLSITNGFNWRILMMGYASGFVIGISIGYMLLYSDGKLWWLSYRIVDEIEYIRRRRRRATRRNARRTTRRS